MADPFSAPTSQTTAATVEFDDKGEPDFSGWLNAQSQAKQKAKNPLPKGLAKTSAARPNLGAKSNSTGNAATSKKAVVAPRVKPTPVKKVEESKEEDEDAWGEAW